MTNLPSVFDYLPYHAGSLWKTATKEEPSSPIWPLSKTVLTVMGGTALGAGLGMGATRILEHSLPGRKIPVHYLGPASTAVGAALLFAAAMRDKEKEKEIDRAFQGSHHTSAGGPAGK